MIVCPMHLILQEQGYSTIDTVMYQVIKVQFSWKAMGSILAQNGHVILTCDITSL